MRIVAIDLGGHTVKATVFSGNRRTWMLEERAEQAVPQDGTASPSLAARLAALQELIRSRPQWAKGGANVALAWPSEMATIHRITLPFTDRVQVEKTLPFAVEAEVPFDLDTMVMGSRIKARQSDTEALVAFTKKEPLRNTLEILANAGLEPRHVFVEADLVARFASKEKLAAVVDVGHGHTIVSVVNEGRVVVARAVNVAGRDFTAAIATAFQCDFAAAEAIKHGATPVPADQLRAALDAPIGLLLAEVRSTLIAAEDVLGREIDEVRVTGGGARLEGLMGFFAHDLGIPVDWLYDDGGDAVPLGWAVPDGMAYKLTGQGVAADDIDLRSGDLAWRGGFDALRAVLLYGAPLVAFMSITFVVVSLMQWRTLNNELADVDERIKETVTSLLPDVDPALVRDGTTAKSLLDERSKEVMARAEILDRTDNTPPTVEKLKALTEAFPPPEQTRVEVSQLTITPENISFDAETDGYASSSAVEESVKKVPRFDQAAKGNEKKNREKVTFTMTIPLVPAGTTEGG